MVQQATPDGCNSGNDSSGINSRPTRATENLEVILRRDDAAIPARVRMDAVEDSEGRLQEQYASVRGSRVWEQDGEIRTELPVGELLSIAKSKIRRQRVQYLSEWLHDSPGVSRVHPSRSVIQVEVGGEDGAPGERCTLPRRVLELRERGEVEITDVSIICGNLRLELEPVVTLTDLEEL